jgi:single-strand DNA-binding protein
VKDGEKKEKVNYVSCLCWGARGETISKFFQRGKEIEVIGELDFQSWETKEGEKRNTLKVNVNQFHFVGGQQDRATGDATKAQEPSFPEPKVDVNEEEIPF